MVVPAIAEYEIDVAPVWPVLVTVQLRTAAVGDVVAAPPEQDKAKAGGVGPAGFTVRLIDVDAADPVFGVADKVPLYVAGAVPEVTVTVPQVAPAAQEPVGPAMVVPAIAEYEIDVAPVWPVLVTVQLRTAAVGDVVAAPPEHDSANAGGVGDALTFKVSEADAVLPRFGVATNKPL